MVAINSIIKTSNKMKTTAATTSASTTILTNSKPKEKRRNNEKRKEKSRDAARCRRSRETEIFSELAQILPLRKEDVNQLDKASIMRIAIAFLKVREMLQLFPKIQDFVEDVKLDSDVSDCCDNGSQMTVSSTEILNGKFDFLKCAETSQFIKQTLDGFLMILSNDGDITYVSDNITDYLGLAKIDILGQQIWEYSHQCDHAELKETLNIKRNGLSDKIKDENVVEEGLSTDHRDLFVRFKCTLTSRGRSINIKSASYKVIHITGHLVANMKGDRVLVAIGRPIPHPSNIEIPLGSTTFLTKHSLDMKFTYVDEKMQNLFGFTSEDLLDHSLFAYHHGGDSYKLMTTFKTVLNKGQGETGRYRFLGKYGGYCWIVTQATIVYDKLKPQSVVCVNYVISNLENNNEIYSLAQYEASKFKVEESNRESDQSNVGDSRCNNNFEKDSSDNIIVNNNTNITDDFKQKLLKCTKEPKFEEKQENQTQENQSTANKNIEIELNSIKATNPPPAPPAPPLNPTTDNNPKNTNTLCLSIKSETTSTITVNPHTTSTIDLDTSPREKTAKSIEVNKPIVNEDILSPTLLRRSVQSSYISSIDNNTNNNSNIKNNNISNKTSLFLPKSQEENRPKSVTASVFRPAALADLNATHLTTASSQSQSPSLPSTTSTSSVFVPGSNTPLPHMNAASRAQSVTASVFTPISQLCNRQQQHIVKTNSIIAPTTVTAAILSGQQQSTPHPQSQAQQAQDMNKFLSFGDDATELTMLKEEPDDLPSLAPAAVDACMRLNGTAPFCDEMLLGLCSYAYSGFLPDDYSSLDSNTNCSSPDIPNNNSNSNTVLTKSNNNENGAHSGNTKIDLGSPKHQGNGSNNANPQSTLPNNNSNHMCNKPVVRVDPFINYREESNDTSCSQHLLSPSVASKSPEASSLPSLCSPNSLSQDDGFAFMTMSVDEDIDMSMRAPYIPMNEQEDLPLLTADDLMWCASNGLCSEELSNQKDVDATLQQLQLQQQHSGENNHNLLTGYHDAQHISQSNFNSLCSSPTSTISSISPSPVNHHQQQQQQDTNSVYSTDTSELAALLCGSGNGQLSILNNNCGSSGGRSGAENADSGLQQAHQHSHCDNFHLQQLQQELASDQQEQQRRFLLGLNIDCKKENSLSPNLCDALEDTFNNVYSKDSTNLDCWNELLQINVNDSSSSTSPSPVGSISSPSQHHQQQTSDDCKAHLGLEQNLSPQHQQHNIILNAVPLITIQDTKNILLQQQRDNGNKLLIKDGILQTSRGGNKTAIKVSNGQIATTITKTVAPIAKPLSANVSTALRIIDVKQQQQQQQLLSNVSKGMLIHQQLQQHQTQQSHKRHLESSFANPQQETKRIKSTAAVRDGLELSAVPQIVQQLAAPMCPQHEVKEQPKQQTRKLNTRNSDSSHSGWPLSGDAKNDIIMQQKQQQQQQQQSNSVLKNLLISGCDTSNFTQKNCMTMDEDSLDQPLSALSPSLTKPLHCQTSTAAVLRNYRHNPMIGGPGVLPSPPFGPVINSDSSSSLTPVDTQYTSDSGIEDISMMETSSPIKIQSDKSNNISAKPSSVCSAATKDMLLMKCLNNKAIKKHASMNLVGGKSQLSQQELSSRPTVKRMDNAATAGITNNGTNPKSSVTNFSENLNPLMEPFIMDLCNDDYDVPTEPFLEPNEIDHVLNDWVHEMA